MKIYLALLLSLTLVACSHTSSSKRNVAAVALQPICSKQNNFTIAVHGGVGYKPNAAQSDVLRQILKDGHALLKSGVSALDVTQHAVEVMEDSGIFNAGRGGTRTNARTVELDASIMDGSDLSAGAVASLIDVKNPIRLARAVKEKTNHVFMVGPGASKLARDLGLETVKPDYFTSDPDPQAQVETAELKVHGTVGAIALDRCGNLAAATSTGGLFGKKPGRVGDSPVIGAGTYANNKTVAVSATGSGEKFIRSNVAVRISNILQYTNRSLKSAIDESMGMVAKMGGDGGLIAIDKTGRAMTATTPIGPMGSGYIRENGQLFVRDLTP